MVNLHLGHHAFKCHFGIRRFGLAGQIIARRTFADRARVRKDVLDVQPARVVGIVGVDRDTGKEPGIFPRTHLFSGASTPLGIEVQYPGAQ